jgi:ATP-binding cassette, subfamily B, bacterial
MTPATATSNPSGTTMTRRAVYRRIGREARPFRPHIAGLLVVSVIGTATALLMPLPLKVVVDSVLGSHPLPGFLDALLPGFATSSDTGVLVSMCALFLGLAVLGQAQELAWLVLSTYTGQKLVLAFRARAFQQVQRLSLSYHDTRGTADSTYRIQWDAPSIRYVAVDGLIPLLMSLATVVGMIAVTAAIDWVLAVIALVVVPLIAVILTIYGRRLLRDWHAAKALESSALSVIQEALGALRVVKAFGREEGEGRRFVDRSHLSVRAEVRLALTTGLLGLLAGTTIALGTALVLYTGVRRVQSGALTLGELLLVMTYLSQLYEPIRTLASKVGDLQSSLASAQRVFAVLDEAPEVVERPGARRLRRAGGAIEFRDVSFAYDGGKPVLHDVSFEVGGGASVGISGPTGAGKTTLASLLTRFYDPTRGAILLDGVDLRDYRLADLREQFAIVLQDTILFSTTVAENIAYAWPDAGESDVVAAARAANAHAFIASLPDGYETVVGERGMRLSGGERQRIALARAFLKDAPILILDEPTSAVDLATEAGIMDAMERLAAGRTTLLITHRLSTLEFCQVRLGLDAGRLEETRLASL